MVQQTRNSEAEDTTNSVPLNESSMASLPVGQDVVEVLLVSLQNSSADFSDFEFDVINRRIKISSNEKIIRSFWNDGDSSFPSLKRENDVTEMMEPSLIVRTILWFMLFAIEYIQKKPRVFEDCGIKPPDDIQSDFMNKWNPLTSGTVSSQKSSRLILYLLASAIYETGLLLASESDKVKGDKLLDAVRLWTKCSPRVIALGALGFSDAVDACRNDVTRNHPFPHVVLILESRTESL